MTDQETAASKRWRVHCDDCELEEDYPEEDTAFNRMVAHSHDHYHSTRVREVEA